MKQHTLRSHALVVAFVAAGLTLVGVSSSAATDVVADGSPLQAGLDAATSTAVTSGSANWLGNFARLEGAGGGELASRIGSISALDAGASSAAPTPEHSPVLGTHPTLGNIAAPVTRFRDGGHAYYLFGAGLHSCTYVGKCFDLFAAIGEPVYAMADGVVKIKPYAGGSYGNYLTIKFRDGSKAIYAHLKDIDVKDGPITAGARIGSVGCSGTSGEYSNCKTSEQHLHMEWNGLRWNPGEYGQLPPYFNAWRGEPKRCYKGCGPATRR